MHQLCGKRLNPLRPLFPAVGQPLGLGRQLWGRAGALRVVFVARHPVIDHAGQQVQPQRQGDVVLAAHLDVMRARIGLGQFAALADRNVLVALPVQQQHAGVGIGQRARYIHAVQIDVDTAAGGGDHLVDVLAAVAPARVRRHRLRLQAFRLQSHQVWNHRADRHTGIGERFHRHHPFHLVAELVGGEYRCGGAIGHAEQVQRAGDFTTRAQLADHIHHIVGFIGAIARRPGTGLSMVAQVERDHAVAGFGQLQRPRQHRITVHHPAVQQHHGTARCLRAERLRYCQAQAGIQRQAVLVALRQVVVTRAVIARIEHTPEDRHAIAARREAVAIGQFGNGRGNARTIEQGRYATRRDQPIGKRGGRGIDRGRACSQPQAGARQQQQQQALHGQSGKRCDSGAD